VKLVVREYLTAGGASPSRRWLETLDLPTRARIQAKDLRTARQSWTEFLEVMNMAKRSRDWNEGLARDLQNPTFAREFLVAAIHEGIPCSRHWERSFEPRG